MSTALTSVFGNEIKVGWQPRDMALQYTGFPGAIGVTRMHLGSRGWVISITGRLRASGASYAAARANLETAIEAIEDYLYAGADTYTYFNMTYYNIVWDRFELLSDFRQNSAGYVFIDFRMTGRGMI